MACLLKVRGRARSDLRFTKDDLLNCTTTQCTHNASKNLLLAHQRGVLARLEPGKPTGLTTGNERYLQVDRAICLALAHKPTEDCSGYGPTTPMPIWAH